MTSLYDQQTERLRAEHRVHINWDGHGWWSCSCGKRQQSTSFNSTPARSSAASQRHLQAEGRRILAELRASA